MIANIDNYLLPTICQDETTNKSVEQEYDEEQEFAFDYEDEHIAPECDNDSCACGDCVICDIRRAEYCDELRLAEFEAKFEHSIACQELIQLKCSKCNDVEINAIAQSYNLKSVCFSELANAPMNFSYKHLAHVRNTWPKLYFYEAIHFFDYDFKKEIERNHWC